MAKKKSTVFICDNCGSESPKWAGQCPVCGSWNSMAEMSIPSGPIFRGSGSGALKEAGSRPVSLTEISRSHTNEAVLAKDKSNGASNKRTVTGITEMDRVLGGGLVPGSLTLISGEPGIGKSTLIMQVASKIAQNSKVLYVSGEESAHQLRDRADRICPDANSDFMLLTDTDIDAVTAAAANTEPALLIIDSIQTMYSSEESSVPGSISQVRACCHHLMETGKRTDIPVLIVAHVNKSGDLAGPKIIEHLVDCVLNFTGDRTGDLRILRASKNRFGSTSEIGAFEMTHSGLKEISDLSARFLEDNYRSDKSMHASGSVIAATYEGSRPLLLEIQALTCKTLQGFPRRTSLGIDNSRLSMILAVLDRKCGLRLFESDVYLNVTGGIRPEGTSTDLAAALAIYSSYCDRPCPASFLAIGELGLTGELRAVKGAGRIIDEASRLGISKIMLPESQAKKSVPPKGTELIGVSHIREAVSRLFEF